MSQINFFAPINSLGYGIAGKNLAIELNKIIEVCLVPENLTMTGVESEEIEPLKKMSERFKNINFKNAGICLGYGNMMFKFCGSKRIGYTVFENTVLCEDWINQLKQLDMAWTFSKWGKQILENYGIECRVVPGGVNPVIFKRITEMKNPINDYFYFISVGKWEPRKNQELLIKAFCKEFKPSEKVKLFGFWNNPFLNENVGKLAEKLVSNGHKINAFDKKQISDTIILCPQLPSQKMFAQLYNQMDCGVFPYRAEGWCLPLMEAMACGLPCIATNYSAPVDFINSENALLLQPGKFADIHKTDSKNYHENSGIWADPDIDELKQLLRFAYENKTKLQNTGINAFESMKNWEWKNSARICYDFLKELL
ncbi:MAG TPA: glycosyltransferase [bacterium]|nr:glycosyltransferase [bacterium]